MTIVLCSELCARFALSERGSEKDRYFNIRVVVGIDTYIHTVSPKIINTFDLFHAKFWQKKSAPTTLSVYAFQLLRLAYTIISYIVIYLPISSH